MPYSDYPQIPLTATANTIGVDCLELGNGNYVAVWEEAGGVRIGLVDFASQTVGSVSAVYTPADLPNPGALLIDCYLVVPRSGGVAVVWLMFVSGGPTYLCSRFYSSGLSPLGVAPSFATLADNVGGGGYGPQLSATRSGVIGSELACILRLFNGSSQPILAGCHVASNGSVADYAVILTASAPQLPTGASPDLAAPMILPSSDGGLSYPIAFDFLADINFSPSIWRCYAARVTTGFALAGALTTILASIDALTRSLKHPWPVGAGRGLVMIDEAGDANAWVISPAASFAMQSDFLTIMPFAFGGNVDPRTVAISSALDIAVAGGGLLIALAATGYGTYFEWFGGTEIQPATMTALAYTGSTPAGVGFEEIGFEPAISYAVAQRFALLSPGIDTTPRPLYMAGFRIVPLMCIPCAPIVFDPSTQSWVDI